MFLFLEYWKYNFSSITTNSLCWNFFQAKCFSFLDYRGISWSPFWKTSDGVIYLIRMLRSARIWIHAINDRIKLFSYSYVIPILRYLITTSWNPSIILILFYYFNHSRFCLRSSHNLIKFISISWLSVF